MSDRPRQELEPAAPTAEQELLPYDASDADDGGAPDAARRPFSPRQLLRYKWSMLAVFILAAPLAVGGVWAFLAPLYQATAVVEISPVIEQVTGNSEMMLAYESFRASQPDLITSPAVMHAVIDEISDTLGGTNWYRDVPATPFEALLERLGLRSSAPPEDRLREQLQIQVPRGKQLMYISLTATTPGEAKRLVDVVIRNYVQFAVGRISDSKTKQRMQLRDAISKYENQLASLEAEIAEMQRQSQVGSPEQLFAERALRVHELELERRRLELQLQAADEAAQKLRESETAASAGAPATQPAEALLFATDPEWKNLDRALRNARRALQAEIDRWGDQNPRLAQFRVAVTDAEDALQRREAQLGALGGTNDTPQVGPVREINLRRELHVLTLLLEEEKKRLQELAIPAQRLATRMQDRDQLKSTLAGFKQRREILDISGEATGNITVTPATEPSTPVEDRRLKLSAAAIMGAMGLALAFGFIRTRINPTVQEVEDVSRPVAGAFLGYLPLRKGIEPESCPLYTEAVRVLRTALLNRLGAAHGSVVQVTSASVGAGKSTLASCLARSLAMCGKRVLLVDADLRCPSLARRFQLERSPGLVELLAGKSNRRPICRTNIQGLSILPAGHSARYQDFELVANGVFSRLLQRWRGEYDVILLDSAPLLGPADAAILSRQADGTLLVIREGHCRREDTLRALAALSAAGGKLLGSVFIGVESRQRYGYSYAYRYGGTREALPHAEAANGAQMVAVREENN